MSRVQQDAFTDDADESCPLCVEEFDLSDKNFKPCPCGYQVCQFCYNNIKNNMNGLCPACRRPYDDQSIEWKVVSQEEQKADIQLQARKKALARKKESEQKQVESNNRKHLAGIRVVQKNLVYVIGLTQQSSEDEFLRTLRGEQYFGQYGRIHKIVVSKPRIGAEHDKSIGIYVTFERREDAAKCIAAVDGSKNLDRALRAQYGTTKYCSAYLRGETCSNRNCTFLHEEGQDSDSFSRQDLSSMNATASMNAMSTQRTTTASPSRPNQVSSQSQPSQQHIPSISATLQSGPAQAVREDLQAKINNDGPALPSTANWAAKNAHQETSRASKPPSFSTPSPSVSASNPVIQHSAQASEQEPEPESEAVPPQPEQQQATPVEEALPCGRPPTPPSPGLEVWLLNRLRQHKDLELAFDESQYSQEELELIKAIPPLFSFDVCIKRYRMKKELEQERMKQEEERNVMGAISTAEDDENLGSGSLQLGGEPDTQEETPDASVRFGGSNRNTIQSPLGSSSVYPFGGSTGQVGNVGNLPRTLTPQQREQISQLQRVGSSRQTPVSQASFQQSYGQNSSMHQHQTSNPFQNQLQAPNAFGSGQGHARQTSRYTFLNESSLAPGAVKPAANPQLSAQQAGVLSAGHGKQYQGQPFQQQSSTPNFYSGVQGPPPGLKSSGTPPISGGGMFGQGHGFASAMGGSAAFSSNTGNKNIGDESMQQFLRARDRGNSGQGPEFGKREFKFPYAQQHMNSDAPASNFLNSLYGSQVGGHQSFQDSSLQKQKKKGKKHHRHANTSSSGGEPPQAPRFPGAAAKVDNLVRNAIDDGPIQLQPAKLPQKILQAPTPAAPGVASTQDFPSLPTPQKAPEVATAPVATPKKGLIAKTVASGVKPAVPKKVPQPVTKGASLPDKKFEDDAVAAKATTRSLTEAQEEPQSVPALSSRAVSEKTTASHATKAAAEEDSNLKRQKPSNIDVGAAQEAARKDAGPTADVSNSPKLTGTTTSSPAQPTTPTTVASQQTNASPIPPTKGPKTLRVGTTMKVGQNSPSNAESSRSSAISAQPPATPSDNASLTSTSVSRANSPPPSRVGSAPVRQISKAQQKKERQARAKQPDTIAPKPEQQPLKLEEPEVVQEPIVGRKKKAKKAKQTPTADSTPAPSRAPSPERSTEPVSKEQKADATSSASQKDKASKSQASQISQAAEFKKAEEPPSTSTKINSQPLDEPSRKAATMTPAALFSHLTSTGVLDPSVADILFKPVPGATTRFEHSADLVTTASPVLSEAQAKSLDNGCAVLVEPPSSTFNSSSERGGNERSTGTGAGARIGAGGVGSGGNRCTVVLPDRRPIGGLNVTQAKRMVELVNRIGVPGWKAEVEGLVPVRRVSTFNPGPPQREEGDGDDDGDAGDGEGGVERELVNRFASAEDVGEGGVGNVGGMGGGGYYEPARELRDKIAAVNAGVGLGSGLGTGVVMSVEEAEARFVASKRETEGIEKRLNALIKKNRRLVGV
ncbi:uncharacterized protein KY384_002753 [Bacidia gigantensis]|uniref:uncharacterized protein n=1 Tax=Bacidia gigantensis TaxID=2732470 RepID=UPI001D045CBB|nr:uncharacterized protein KY384_002753 [Bacidia gigantensis]KAG8532875.1 hypothetical protein KY384_002753 [Bacidia gigantensis]